MRAYEAHEDEYARMKKEGIRSWDLRSGSHEIVPDAEAFLKDTLSQRWAPREGTALELGCGTGPILRMLSRHGFKGLGIDISKTAVEMARNQSKGYNTSYRVGDICALPAKMKGNFDLIVDGHAVHCLTAQEDRASLFRSVRSCLTRHGVFVLMSMCSPVNRSAFSLMCPGQRVVDRILYAPAADCRSCADIRNINGKPYMPTRRIESWRGILKDLRQQQFVPMLWRFGHCTAEDPFSSLNVAAVLAPVAL